MEAAKTRAARSLKPEAMQTKLHRPFLASVRAVRLKKHNRPPKTMTKKQKEKSRVTPRCYKLADACIYLGGLSKSTVRRAVKRRLLTPSVGCRVWLFPLEELDRFSRSRSVSRSRRSARTSNQHRRPPVPPNELAAHKKRSPACGPGNAELSDD